MTTYLFFYGHSKANKYGFMSNFYLSNFTDENDQKFDCVERYMHYKKAILFKDQKSAEHILSVKTAVQIKSWGRKVKNFDFDIWNQYKKEIVKKGLLFKFNQNKEISDELKKTEDTIIVEAAPNDAIWGIGYSVTEAMKNKDKWGQNLLGKCLMEVRGSI